jgi:hypothetical protein
MHMSSFGEFLADPTDRHEIGDDFANLAATSFLAVTASGNDYSAALTAAPVRTFYHEEENCVYLVREAHGVTIGGQTYPDVIAIGYCTQVGALLALAADDRWVRRSSALAALTMY